MPNQVRRNDELSRYEIIVDGEVAGIADFRVNDDVVVFPHTVIVPDRRGQGLAAELVQGALDDARSREFKVVPACWYVAQFIADHAGYADLVAS